LIKPYKDEPGTRKQQVEQMFNAIAGKYDFLNHFLSMNTDVRWRRKVVKSVKRLNSASQISLNKLNILDVATGTGDMAIALSKLKPASVIGVDISEEMLKVAVKKAALKKINSISFQSGDSESLNFPDKTFHFVTVAFGVRNYEDLEKGISEMHRVLKDGGYLLILEFSQPSGFMGALYNFYSKRILPVLAGLFTADPRAYQYLPESIYAFPHGEKMRNILLKAGFKTSEFKKLSGGIASLYISLRSQA
jgi:demethylmenaquinone methyltransferase/2-methoxy-6-polyprenyl-1,4-benzoquinol methylase